MEVIPFSEPAAIRIRQDKIEAIRGGTACLRFTYRDTADENNVQTLCVVVFDETGDCSGQPTVTLDLQRFLGMTPQLVGNANLIESGEGLFYAACLSFDGAYRLQQPSQSLPPLYFAIVDALGDGAYSLGSSELPVQRHGTITTHSGEELIPPWIVFVSLEISALKLTDDLAIQLTADNCGTSPACTLDPDIVQPGDILRVSAGISSDLLSVVFAETSETLRDRFFIDRIGISWSEIAEVHPDAQRMAFFRLVTADLMAHVVESFDALYSLREKGIPLGYLQPWPSDTPLPFPGPCFPDDIVPGETERCTRIEQAIQATEARHIQQLQQAGFELWYANSIDYGEGGEYSRFDDLRPHFSLFDGILVSVGANSSNPVDDIPSTLATAVREFASEVGSEIPVLLSLNGPPITAQTGGPFCEAEICPSDFKGAYEQGEALLNAALQSLAPEQFLGFGVALFEGSHFDIRDPFEGFSSFSLNRVGETGYNNPLLNLYRAQ